MRLTRILHFALIAFILLAAQTSNAQNEIKFNNYNMLDGLSNSTVQKIIQDEFGFIWIGTNDGLNRYDGYNFKVYREDPDLSNSLLGNLIIDIYEDKQNNLWIGTEKALNLYNRDSDNFSSFQIDPSVNQQFFNGILSIYEDSENVLWVGKAFHGLTKFNRETLQYERFILTQFRLVQGLLLYSILLRILWEIYGFPKATILIPGQTFLFLTK